MYTNLGKALEHALFLAQRSIGSRDLSMAEAALAAKILSEMRDLVVRAEFDADSLTAKKDDPITWADRQDTRYGRTDGSLWLAYLHDVEMTFELEKALAAFAVHASEKQKVGCR